MIQNKQSNIISSEFAFLFYSFLAKAGGHLVYPGYGFHRDK